MVTAARFGLAMVALTAAWPVVGQTIVELPNRAKFDAVFDGIKGDHLKCNARSMEPWIDFGFRFVLRYSADCEVSQFGGLAAELKAYLRVRPEDGNEKVFGDKFLIPVAPKGFALTNLRRVQSQLEFSGAVAAGIGAYDVDLLLVDDHNRIYRKRWKAKALPQGRERDLKFAMLPNALASVTTIRIPARVSGAKGMPITVLLNAAPLNPWARKLRAWDRAFLLDSLSSLLRQVSYSSVRVIAFNLDQQQEIFRQENFGEDDMPKLSEALRRLELGKIAYGTLERKNGWAELLLGLLRQEVQAEQRSEAVVFLGPTLRLDEKAPAEMLVGYQAPAVPLFCVTYYPRVGADFPDSIQYLTSALKGKIFRIHSPRELAQNLEKLQRDMERDASARTMRALK